MYAAQSAIRFPERPAIIMAGSQSIVTFAEFEAAANRLAHLLRREGLVRLGHVAQILENNPRFFTLPAAAARTGLYYTAINAHLSADEAAYIVNDSQSQLLVSSYAMADVVRDLPLLCPGVRRFLMMDGVIEGWESFEEAVKAMPTNNVVDERVGGVMLYSSGTTGRPKGILKALPDATPDGPQPVVAMMNKLYGFDESSVYLSPAPLYHAAPLMMMSFTVQLGRTAIILEKFDAEAFLAAIERHRITHVQVVPTMLARLLKLPEQVRGKYDISSLRSVVHAGAPCSIPLKEQAIAWLGPILSEYYSASEGIGMTWCTCAEWQARKGTVGRPVLGALRILDEAGRPCEVGEPGQVWFSGAADFEYFNDQEKTRVAHDASGRAGTVGDIGYVDADGYLYLTDRASHTIISGGVNIYPQEIENVLGTHPAVADVAVIGIPDEEFGEQVKAIVQVEPGVVTSEQLANELIELCRSMIAHYKCPRSVDFTKQLPRLPTGKLAKHKLKEEYWQGRPLVGAR